MYLLKGEGTIVSKSYQMTETAKPTVPLKEPDRPPYPGGGSQVTPGGYHPEDKEVLFLRLADSSSSFFGISFVGLHKLLDFIEFQCCTPVK